MKKLLAIVLGVALAGVGTVALAARNSAGTYTLPSGNPVIPATRITSAWANTLTADIAAELTDSASRSGKGGFTAPLRLTPGTAAIPALAFTAETNSGLYRQAAGDIRLAVGGSDSLQCTATGVTVPGTLAVTGASTLSGASTLTGVATFAATPVLQAGATVSSGDVTLSQAATQTISKTGGMLKIEAAGANEVRIAANSTTRIILPAAGGVSVEGHVVSNVGTPTAATDATTKGYVDTGHAGAIVAGGRIVGSTGQINGGFGTSNNVRNVVGDYTITLSASYSNNSPAVSLNGTANGFVRVKTRGANTFNVITVDAAGAAADLDWSFIVVAGP